MSLITELKRRNVFRVGVAYAIVAWLLVEVASVFLPALRLPEWTLTLLVFLVVAGFPLALILAWAFELTPEGILSDNGVPFATLAIGRLSRLSVWWIRLGIHHKLIEPGHPEQNGRHERMHRTLKQQTARPPAATLRGQQQRFNRFRTEFNEERPHEALRPGDYPLPCMNPSPREFPSKLPPIEYPAHFEKRAQ